MSALDVNALTEAAHAAGMPPFIEPLEGSFAGDVNRLSSAVYANAVEAGRVSMRPHVSVETHPLDGDLIVIEDEFAVATNEELLETVRGLGDGSIAGSAIGRPMAFGEAVSSQYIAGVSEMKPDTPGTMLPSLGMAVNDAARAVALAEGNLPAGQIKVHHEAGLAVSALTRLASFSFFYSTGARRLIAREQMEADYAAIQERVYAGITSDAHRKGAFVPQPL